MGPLLLIITTFIWGTAFLAQKLGADYLGPLAMTTFRNLLGGLFLVLCIFLRRNSQFENSIIRKFSILSGLASGVPLFLAMLTQQIGIEKTTPGISAFLTTNYVIFVPLIYAIGHTLNRSFGHSVNRLIFLYALMALLGTYLICLSAFDSQFVIRKFENSIIDSGESWTILCALLFSVQMIVVDRLAPRCDVLVMSASQLLTCFVIGLPLTICSSEWSAVQSFPFTWGAIWPVLYCGVLSSGVAYTLQNFGQARTSAPVAAVLLSLESVFGALSGFIVLGDTMTLTQFCGCGIIFLAALLASIRSKG